MELSKGVDRVLNALAGNPKFAKPTISRKHLKELLLYTEGWLTAAGAICEIKNKHLGASVYRVWLERVNK